MGELDKRVVTIFFLEGMGLGWGLFGRLRKVKRLSSRTAYHTFTVSPQNISGELHT